MSRVRSFGAFENPTTTLDATNGRTDERTNA